MTKAIASMPAGNAIIEKFGIHATDLITAHNTILEKLDEALTHAVALLENGVDIFDAIPERADHIKDVADVLMNLSSPDLPSSANALKKYERQMLSLLKNPVFGPIFESYITELTQRLQVILTNVSLRYGSTAARDMAVRLGLSEKIIGAVGANVVGVNPSAVLAQPVTTLATLTIPGVGLLTYPHMLLNFCSNLVSSTGGALHKVVARAMYKPLQSIPMAELINDQYFDEALGLAKAYVNVLKPLLAAFPDNTGPKLHSASTSFFSRAINLAKDLLVTKLPSNIQAQYYKLQTIHADITKKITELESKRAQLYNGSGSLSEWILLKSIDRSATTFLQDVRQPAERLLQQVTNRHDYITPVWDHLSDDRTHVSEWTTLHSTNDLFGAGLRQVVAGYTPSFIANSFRSLSRVIDESVGSVAGLVTCYSVQKKLQVRRQAITKAIQLLREDEDQKHLKGKFRSAVTDKPHSPISKTLLSAALQWQADSQQELLRSLGTTAANNTINTLNKFLPVDIHELEAFDHQKALMEYTRKVAFTSSIAWIGGRAVNGANFQSSLFLGTLTVVSNWLLQTGIESQVFSLAP